LIAIASFGTKNDPYLLRLVREYCSMPFSVDIVVLSNIAKEVAPGVEVSVGLPAKNPWSLPFPHKQIFAERLDDYDLFIYSEDDTLVTERNIRAFLRVAAVLPENEIPGFFRVEQGTNGHVNYPEVHGHFHWDPGSVRSRDEYTFAFFTNEHAACYAITRPQLQRAINSGGFLVGPHEGKYDLLCSAATDPYTQCGFQKLVCISHLEDFLVHHLPNKYVDSKFGVDGTELRRQVEALLRIGQNGRRPKSLFQTESKLKSAAYSKDYYEPVRDEIVFAIPSDARTVLSVGCGWGATEASLVQKGLQVAAVPLDSVISGGALAKGVEMIDGDLVEARRALTGRGFDCLLLSNVLHLVPDPIELLASFGALLQPGGTCVVVAPNTEKVRTGRKDKGLKREGGPVEYEETGVQACSHEIIEEWFRESGMRVETFTDLLGPRALKLGRLTLGLVNSRLASEFIAVAKKQLHSHRPIDPSKTN
jgi:SAM-dependent methyltransferase